jgi:site-specific DNA-methyltransferase (adenine-specific)
MERPFARIALPQRRAVTFWCEDAVPGLARRVLAGAADVVVTSPPYNLGVAYRSYADSRPRAEYLAWVGTLRDAVAGALSTKGSFFLNVGGPPSDPWLPWDVAREVGRTFVLQNVIHWVKSIAIDRSSAGKGAALDRDLALGHYKPLVSERFLHGAHEYIFHFSRAGDVPLDRLAIGIPYQDKSNIQRWGRSARDRRCRGNTWFLPYSTIRIRSRDRPHPATFPPELPEWCLRLHGLDRVKLAVDPFVGIGASAVAAARCDVDFVGFDLDAEYLRVAATRVRAETARPASKRSRPVAAKPRST